MSLPFEPLLTSLCASVESLHANGTQSVFLLGDADDARLSYDLLTVCGFQAKLYPEGRSSARLYITNPDAGGDEMLARANHYARSLQSVKQSLVNAGSEHSIGFMNNGNGKQIVIHIPEAPETARAPIAESPPIQSPVSAPAQPAQAKPRPAATVAKKKAKPAPDSFAGGGPAVGKGASGANSRQDGFVRETYLKLVGHQGLGISIVGAILAGLLVAFAIFGVTRMALCRDIATTHINNEWYCGK